MPSPIDRNVALTILRWHVDAGVDWAVDDTPHDRFAESAEAASRRPGSDGGDPPRQRPAGRSLPQGPARPVAAAPRPVPVAPLAAAESARALAASARTLEEWRAVLGPFDGCALKAPATRLAFADGDPEARLMLVGEAPGADEDLQGK